MGVPTAAFDSDRLVLLWPLRADERTAEGVAVGTTVYRAWLAYPDAEAMRPMQGLASDALLVKRAGHGYLIWHDGAVVRAVVAGTEDLLRAAYTCR